MGAILAEDMTIEAVIAKLSYVIGKGYKGSDIRKMMLTDLRGEISTEMPKLPQTGGEESLMKILSLVNDKKDEITEDSLNKIVKILQPIAIHSAAESSDLEKIDELINKGVDINLIDKQGNTALHIAVNNNDIK